MTRPVICKLLRFNDVREVFTVHLPADPAQAHALLVHHRDSSIRGDNGDPRSRRYRLAVHAMDETHLYDVEATT